MNSIDRSTSTIIPARSGQPTLKLGDRLLHSSYDPVREARREVEALVADDPALVVILGCGLGYAIDAALELLPRAKIVAVEAEPAIHEAARAARRLPESERLTWMIGRNEKANFTALTWALDSASATSIRYLPRLAELDPDFYASIVALAGKAVAMHIESLRSTFSFGRLWWENSVRNWRRWATNPDVAGWFGAHRGQPVFVLAAGPSLQDALPLLARGEGGIRFVVDTAYQIVARSRIRIDAVFAIDGQKTTLRHFDDRPPARLVAAPVIPPALWAMAGESLLMSLAGAHFQWFDETLGLPVARLKSGGSVTTFAFDLARRMGAEPIVLFGADFAHRGGRTHTGGTWYEQRAVESIGRFRGIEQMTRRSSLLHEGHETDGAFVQYAQWMAWEIAETRQRVYRAADFGLLTGTPVIAAAELERLIAAPAPVLATPPPRRNDPRRLIEAFKVEREALVCALAEPKRLNRLSGFFDPIIRPFAVASRREALADAELERLLEILRAAAATLDAVIAEA